MSEFDALIESVREEHAPDPRTAVFDVAAEDRDGAVALVGETTEPDAVGALREAVRAAHAEPEIVDEVLRLPEPALGEERHALVRSALAPVHAGPAVSSAQVSQFVLGHRLDLLARDDVWWRVRGEDGYIGWVHHGFLEVGTDEWARTWERAAGAGRAVSLGAELVDDSGASFARLPWGARLFRDTPEQFRLPDGRGGRLGEGEVVGADRLGDRFPPRGESVVRTARRWVGVPYVWGGVTPGGADCSGYVQSVFWMHGIALPRDSDQQAELGAPVDPGDDFDRLQPGDLLFFAEGGERVTHVAISLDGPGIIHSALANGGVRINDLTGDLGTERRLRRLFRYARRTLPD